MKQPATILIVEDDRSMLDGMHDLLETVNIGYELKILTASDGRIALQRVNEITPDLIVSDIMMPNMDGYQFLHKIRENPGWLHIPFIFLTAKGEKEEIHVGRVSGANLYIVKPFNSNHLIELIESQLKKSFNLQKARKNNVDNLKKEILQILNHEFRTPLTYVTAYYEMLADGLNKYSGEQNFQGYLRGIQAGCLRLNNLVEDLIQVIELRTGDLEARYYDKAKPIINIDLLLTKAIQSKKARAEQSGVQIYYSPRVDLPPIFGHEENLVNVFQRLLDNAIKFTHIQEKTPKNIFVSVKETSDELQICFEDQGIGFPKQINKQIFETFFQYNRELVEQQGAGVGLTIAKGIIDLHRGRIEAESEMGKGSKFIVCIPIYHGEAHEFVLTKHSDTIPQATVLIVEDDAHLLEGLQELLEISTEKYIFTALTAANGMIALEILSENKPDLIISDIMMPQMGGFELLEKVRQNPDWVQIPFLFLSAKGERHEIHDGLLSGAEEYITKPYDSDELLDLITIQLDRYFQVQGLLTQNFNALKRSILDLITPEFRLPLSSVSEYSDKLSHGFTQARNEEDLKESLHGIQESSMRLARLVEDFISLAEIKTGEAVTAFNINAQIINNIGGLFYEAGLSIKHQSELKDLQIRLTADENLPLLFGDPVIIFTTIQRVIKEGVKLCQLKPDNDIYLSAFKDDEGVSLAFRFSTNPQIPILNEISSILTIDDSELSEVTNSSTGLRIIKGYVELHDGRITFTHNEVYGCTFTIFFPAYSPPPEL